MTKETEKPAVYVVKEHPDMSFAKIPHEEGMTYEFDLRVKASPLMADLLKDKKKGEALPRPPGYVAPTRGKVFDLFFKNSGHVFYNLSIKKGGKVIGERQIGFSADENPDPKKKAEAKVGVPGFVFDQEKANPTHHYNKTFELSRAEFDNVVKYIEDSVKNPPNYIWPLATNCAKFAKKSAKAAGIPNASLTSVFNLPITTQIYMNLSKTAGKVENAAKKVKNYFSSSRQAPIPQKAKTTANEISKAVINKKTQSR